MALSVAGILQRLVSRGSRKTAVGRDEAFNYVTLEEDPYGYLKIVDVPFQRGIYGSALKALGKPTVQRLMNQYFDAEVKIFEDVEANKEVPHAFWNWVWSGLHLLALLLFALAAIVALALLHEGRGVEGAALLTAVGVLVVVFLLVFHGALSGGFRDSNIWPGFLEDRLMAFTAEKFTEVDNEIRYLIDAFTIVFQDNLSKFIAQKRVVQSVASFVVIIFALAPAVAVMSGVPTLALPLGALAVLVWLLSFYLFWYFTRLIRRDHYMVSLDKSCETISHTLDQRLRSLSECIKEAVIDLTQLRERGQHLENENIEDDDHFEGMAGFFEMQKMLWLAKRSEYQELYLVDAVHKMRRTYFIQDMQGYRSALLVTLVSMVGALVPLMVAVGAGTVSTVPTLEDLPLIVFFLIPMLIVGAFGWLSYKNPDWNTGTDTLRKKLDSSRWLTYAKLKIDAKLAGQYQRALATIAKLNEQLANQ